MKRMMPSLLVAIAALTVCGWLVLRQVARPSGDTTKALPVDRWQSGIRVDRRTDCVLRANIEKRIKQKLRQEERRQRPWEGRN